MTAVSISITRGAQIQDLIDAARITHTTAVIPGGAWEIDEPINVVGPVRVRFESTTIRPSLDWNPVDAAMIVTGTGVVLEGDVTFDLRGYYRLLGNCVGQAMLCTNLTDFDFARLHARANDAGVASSIDTVEDVRSHVEEILGDTLENLWLDIADPSGPDFMFVALDEIDDVYTYYNGAPQYRAVIGPCKRGTVGWLESVRDERTTSATCVRFASNWLEARAFEDFTNTCEEITVERLTVRGGDYTLNCFQTAGSGTRRIHVGLIEAVDAKTLATWHNDKGSSFCRAGRVEIARGGKPDYYIGDVTKRFTGVSFTGNDDANVIANTNTVGEIVFRDCDSVEDDVYESAFSCEHCTGCRVDSVDVDGLNVHDGQAAGKGCAVLVGDGANVWIGSVKARNVQSGILSNANSPIGDVTIEHVDIEALASGGVYLTVAGASGRAVIGGGRIKTAATLGAGVPQLSFDAELTSVHVGPVEVSGGGTAGIGIYAACPLTVDGARVLAQGTGLQADGAGAKIRALGVDASTCTVKTSAINGGTIVGAGNSWQD